LHETEGREKWDYYFFYTKKSLLIGPYRAHGVGDGLIAVENEWK